MPSNDTNLRPAQNALRRGEIWRFERDQPAGEDDVRTPYRVVVIATYSSDRRDLAPWGRLTASMVMIMASPEPTVVPVAPALVAPTTPEAIRDALAGSERVEFERRYREEMTAAAESLNLTGVLAVLDNYRRIAEMTQCQGTAVHERMLAVAAELMAGREVPTISAVEQRARINTRLGY